MKLLSRQRQVIEMEGFLLRDLPEEKKQALIRGIANEFRDMCNRNIHKEITDLIENMNTRLIPGDELRVRYELTVDFASISLAINMLNTEGQWTAPHMSQEEGGLDLVVPLLRSQA